MDADFLLVGEDDDLVSAIMTIRFVVFWTLSGRHTHRRSIASTSPVLCCSTISSQMRLLQIGFRRLWLLMSSPGAISTISCRRRCSSTYKIKCSDLPSLRWLCLRILAWSRCILSGDEAFVDDSPCYLLWFLL